jgi:hypothetical protein
VKRIRLTKLCVVAACAFLVVGAHAKRGPKPQVPPINVNGIEIRAPNNPDTEGVIQAWDPNLNKLLWSKRVYRTLKDPLLEQDVQWVFIKSMALTPDQRGLVIVDERDRTHLVPIRAPGNLSHTSKLVIISLFALSILVAIKMRRLQIT